MKPTDPIIVEAVRRRVLAKTPRRRGNGGPARVRSALRIIITLKDLEEAGFALCLPLKKDGE